ncbi:MAG: phosphoserine phosphatase SerB [Erythrobacter sp.]
MLIARLIADPSTLETRLDAASGPMRAAGMAIEAADIIDHAAGILQLKLPKGDHKAVRSLLNGHFAPSALLLSDHTPKCPAVFVSDMDSTMIQQECIDELADFAGLKDRVAAITERAMIGELDFEDALRERVGLLAGLDQSAISTCLEERITLTPGAKTLVANLRAAGCKTVLVTGGFHHFADAVADQLGFERVVGNRLEVSDGKLTGRLVGAITDAATKAGVLEEEMASLGEGARSSVRSLATGDGANDIPMLERADYGFAYCGKEAARDAANGQIDQADISVILPLLGVRVANRY